MAEYTSNYQLHQWVPEDDFLRTVFNTDFQKLDEALAGLQTALDGKCQLKRGNFNGNGGSSRLVITGPTPEAVILSTGSTVVSVISDDSTISGVKIVDNGFEVYSGSPNMNQSGKRYNYVALI